MTVCDSCDSEAVRGPVAAAVRSTAARRAGVVVFGALGLWLGLAAVASTASADEVPGTDQPRGVLTAVVEQVTTPLADVTDPVLSTVTPLTDPVLEPVAPLLGPVAPLLEPLAPVLEPLAPVLEPLAPVLGPLQPTDRTVPTAPNPVESGLTAPTPVAPAPMATADVGTATMGPVLAPASQSPTGVDTPTRSTTVATMAAATSSAGSTDGSPQGRSPMPMPSVPFSMHAGTSSSVGSRPTGDPAPTAIMPVAEVNELVATRTVRAEDSNSGSLPAPRPGVAPD